MNFELIPLLELMRDFYGKPRDMKRFGDYLSLLQDENGNDLILPIMGFNPMAKDHVRKVIQELIDLEAELIIENAIAELNESLTDIGEGTFKIVSNIADDVHGAWTNYFTTDFNNKFKFSAIAKRGFCTPYFFTSEKLTPELIRIRTLAYGCRTAYWKLHGSLHTLEDHVNQEIFVAERLKAAPSVSDPNEISVAVDFYNNNKLSEEYSLIFNFFYGDEAAATLNFTLYGMASQMGFEYASIIANQKNVLYNKG